MSIFATVPGSVYRLRARAGRPRNAVAAVAAAHLIDAQARLMFSAVAALRRRRSGYAAISPPILMA